MFSRVVKRKIPADYILTDTWFTSVGLLKKPRSICSSTHIIGIYEYNSKIEAKSKVKTISQLKEQRTKPKRCRRFKYYHQHYITDIDGLKVSVFLSKRGSNGKSHTLKTTDTALKFVKQLKYKVFDGRSKSFLKKPSSSLVSENASLPILICRSRK